MIASPLGRTTTAVGRAVDRLARLIKPNRRNGGGPRLGTSFVGIDLEAARARFEAKYTPEPNTGCWLWTGATNTPGYGAFAVVSKHPIVMVSAHRYAYSLEVGPIPPGLTLDHRCRQPSCVNPAHLEPVTVEENVRRAAAFHVFATHCSAGHEYAGANLYVGPGGRRACRACRNASKQRRAHGYLDREIGRLEGGSK